MDSSASPITDLRLVTTFDSAVNLMDDAKKLRPTNKNSTE
jgi:hypothetical protein